MNYVKLNEIGTGKRFFITDLVILMIDYEELMSNLDEFDDIIGLGFVHV